MPSTKHGLFVACWVVAVVSVVGPVVARVATVATKQGQQFVGELVSETGDKVTLKIEGVTVSIDRENIERVDYQQTIEEQYIERRAALDQQDADAWYRLAYWLFDQDAYGLAARELAEMGKVHPNDTRVGRLSSVVTAKVKLADGPSVGPGADSPIVRDDRAPGARRPDRTPDRDEEADGSESASRLSERQINAIKVWEVDLDEKPTVTIHRDVIDEFLQRYRGVGDVPLGGAEERRFRSMPGHEQLRYIFGVKARQFYDRVSVRGDPSVMKTFRTNIHKQYVLNYCGTTQCHGGGVAEGPELIKSAPLRESTIYTNFFVLNSYETRRHYMIDRVEPEESLLLQYGLDRERAMSPHPEVARWRPRFANKDSVEFVAIRDWIKSLQRPAPKYNIRFGDIGAPGEEPTDDLPVDEPTPEQGHGDDQVGE